MFGERHVWRKSASGRRLPLLECPWAFPDLPRHYAAAQGVLVALRSSLGAVDAEQSLLQREQSLIPEINKVHSASSTRAGFEEQAQVRGNSDGGSVESGSREES